jgi:aminopeptidase
VFATPDPELTEGTLRATRPLTVAGVEVRGLELRFEHGRVCAIEAAAGAEVVRGLVALDDGGGRLGEVALVDGDSPVGRFATAFGMPLLDENAACHVALGQSLDGAANVSAHHTDVMIGSSEVSVYGMTGAGERLPLIRSNRWVLA